MPYNYQEISQDLIRNLAPRTKDIISRRFGLKSKDAETLQIIGDSYNITRERVRQIEADGFRKIKPALAQYQKLSDYFQDYLKNWGGLRKEDKLLEELGQEKTKNQVFFLMTLADPFERHLDCEDFHTLWAIGREPVDKGRKLLSFLVDKFKKINTPLSEEEIFELLQKEKRILGDKEFNNKSLFSLLEASKAIWQSPNGFWGLPDWSEINPRGIKDRAYLVFKNQKKPLHFKKVADFITELKQGKVKALPQTVHNELIRDPRFILVGRGIYALKEWGYEPGVVKDVISRVLKQNKKPLAKEEIIEQVLGQRLVKPSTVLANLQDRKVFIRDEEGRYRIKKV